MGFDNKYEYHIFKKLKELNYETNKVSPVKHIDPKTGLEIGSSAPAPYRSLVLNFFIGGRGNFGRIKFYRDIGHILRKKGFEGLSEKQLQGAFNFYDNYKTTLQSKMSRSKKE